MTLLQRLLFRRLMESTPGMDGSTSNPSTAPSGGTNEPGATGNDPGEAGFDFASLATDGGGESGNATPPTPPSATPPVAKPPVSGVAAAPAAPPAGQVAQPPSPAATPPAPPAASAAATPPPAATPQPPQGQPPGQSPAAAPGSEAGTPTKDQLATTFAEHRQKMIPQLQQLYQFDPVKDKDAIEELRTAPETALPKLAAQLHYEVQMGAINSVMEILPQMIGTIMTKRTEVEKLTTDFKTMWPDLHSDPQREKVAENAIRSVRQLNPQMKMDEVLRQAGALAMVTLGLPIQMPGAPAAPAAPAAPVVTGAPPAPPPTGRPAGVAGAGGSPLTHPAAGDEGNIFSELVAAHMDGRI